MDDEPQTKQTILERFRSAAEALDAAIAPLSDEQLLSPPAGGGWSKRDILAHIAADQRWWAGQLRAAIDGRPPSPEECFAVPAAPPATYDMATQDGRNAWQHDHHADQPLAVIRELLATSRARLVELANELPDDEYAKPYAIVDSGYTGQVRPARDGEQAFPLWQWFRGNTWHHYEDHLGGLQA
jgi:uncharacterized protein (TIGR03083 family)